MSSGGSLQRYFQSSILKRDGDDGIIAKSKKVHFARSQPVTSPVLQRLKSRPHEMDASMVSKSWSTSKASRRRQYVKEVEGSGESDSGVPQSNSPSASASAAQEPEEFEVESILGHKMKPNGGYLYLLKWKGYSHADNTWEPSSNLFCKPMLDEYRVKHNLVHPGAHSTSGSSKHLKSRHQAPTLIRSTEHKVLQEHLKAEETISVFMKKPPRVFKKTKKLVLKSLSGVRTLNGNNNWSKQAARHMKRLKRHRRRRKEFRVSIDLENGIIVNKHRSFLDNCATCVSATCVSGDLPGTNGFHKAATVDKPLACPSPRKDNDKSHCDVINVSDDEDLIEVVSDSPILTNNHSTPTKQVNSISGTTLTNYNNIDHHVTCVKHDHTYSCPQEDSSFRHSETPPSVLTPPPSAEPSDHLPNFTSSKEPHIYSVAISPPSSPPSSPLDIPSRCSTPVPPPSEIHEIDSDDEQLTDDCSLNSPNPPPSPPSLNSYKLHWSSTSSLSSDFDMCSVSETSKQTPAQSPAVESASETSKASLQTTAQPPQETTVKLPMGRQLDSCDVNASTTREEQPDASILPRWRKGPVPLPRSFSKRPAGASPLQTKAAKVDYLENGCHKPSKRRQKLSLSLKKALKRSISNDENSNSEQQATAMECVPEKSLYSSICAYKEQLMNWQYELNKQRDGTDDIIYVENDLDMVPPPIDFNYICSNRYAEGVPNPSDPDLVSSLCGCECYYLGRKCGPKSEYCCANMAGSKFAYTPAGKIKVQPGTPIYECNAKCSCPSDCSNRIVQLGRKIPLCIFRTEGRGWGVKTTEPIKPNTFVTEYVGEVITNEEAEKRGKKCDAQGITYLFDLDFEDDNSAFTIDAASYGNISHFFNHSCDPNLMVYSVWIDTLDKRLPRLAFFTTRSISIGEELTFDYQMNSNCDFSVDSSTKMPCLCGAKNCLGFIN